MKQAATPQYYCDTATPYDPLPSLAERTQARVVVIGGGFAGLNTALGLVERGVRDVVLLEGERIGFGASGRNGGFVFAGYSLGESALLNQLNAARAVPLFQLTRDAVKLIRERIAGYAIACDLVDQGVIWANWFRDPDVLSRRQQLLAESYGVHWQRLGVDELREIVRTDRYHGGLFEQDALHLHPLNYAIGLASAAVAHGVRIHEHSAAMSLQKQGAQWRVCTPHGEVAAEHVVLACGGYLSGLVKRVDRAVLPIATYVMTTEPLGERLDDCLRTRAAIYDSRFAFDYYRALPDSRLLWGGRISVCDRSPHAVQRMLRADLVAVFPQLRDIKVSCAWSGLMSYARHQMPQIGGDGHGLWWAQAFGGHGVATTCAAGELLASAIAEGDDRWTQFIDFGLSSTRRPLGYAAAQAGYWWQQGRDWLKTGLEG